MIWILLITLTIGAGLASFDQYLQPGENITIINKSLNFTHNNQTYSCVIHYFNDDPTFLVCNGDIISNKTEIRNILFLYGYHKLQRSLNLTKNNITQLILEFNRSRFDGDTGFPGKEEQFCRVYLGEVIKDLYYTNPINQKIYPDIYHYYENYLCGTEVIDCSYNMTLVPELKAFFENSYGLDKNISEFLKLINKLNIKNYSAQYNTLINIVDSLNKSSQILAQSPFRFDRGCSTCYAVCPTIHTKTDLLNTIKTILDNYYYDTFLLNLPTISEKIYNNTQYRLNIKNTNILISTYKPQLDKMNKQFNSLKLSFNNLTKHFKNKTFANMFYNLEKWVNETNDRVEKRNVSHLKYYITNALNRIPKINNTLLAQYRTYGFLKKLREELETEHFLYINAYTKHNKKILHIYEQTLELLSEPINASDIPIILNNTYLIKQEFEKPYNENPNYSEYIIELNELSRFITSFVKDIEILKIVLALIMGGVFASFAFVVGYLIKRALVGHGFLIILFPTMAFIGLIMAYYTYNSIINTNPSYVKYILSDIKENGTVIYDNPLLKQCAQQFNITTIYYNVSSNECWENDRKVPCNTNNYVLYITLTDKNSSFLVYGEPIYKVIYYINPSEVDKCLLAKVG